MYSEEEISKQAEENYLQVKKYDDIVNHCADIAGITKEQAYKFMDSFCIVWKQEKDY